ncbi:unnamed protein product [Schistosoma margrebowiei]|uniref:Uncharacterized protein n=1 Tax=Schistosoma margrebowiei TaxID=48269 RepID=A0A183LU75_9TREM|nr:unnamed protein product [Schistosoma margrebowiei]
MASYIIVIENDITLEIGPVMRFNMLMFRRILPGLVSKF